VLAGSGVDHGNLLEMLLSYIRMREQIICYVPRDSQQSVPCNAAILKLTASRILEDPSPGEHPGN